MEYCKRCKEYWLGQTPCPCKPFTVTDSDGEEYQFYAKDEKEAALAYARDTNENGDYVLMNDSEVIQVGGVYYEVGAEPDIYYHAEPVKGQSNATE